MAVIDDNWRCTKHGLDIPAHYREGYSIGDLMNCIYDPPYRAPGGDEAEGDGNAE